MILIKYAPYQQTLFYDGRKLEDRQALKYLYPCQEGELVIKVIVSRAKTIQVLVTFGFQTQNESSQFKLNVEENLYPRDLRKMVENRIGMSSFDIEIDVAEEIMFCEQNNEKINVSVHKTIHIITDRLNENDHLSNKLNWIVTSPDQTKCCRLDWKKYEIDPLLNNSDVQLEELVCDLESGTRIYSQEVIERKECIIS